MIDINLQARGNIIFISGSQEQVHIVEAILKRLYKKLENNIEISNKEIEAEVRMASDTIEKENTSVKTDQDIVIKTKKKHIRPFTNNQRQYISTLKEKEMVFAYGPAGTGKTYLAVAVAISMLLNKEIERLILSRPAVEAGEKLGFLPGDMKDKVDPYLQPLYDALHDMLPAEQVKKYLDTHVIEIAPLAFMRGRTLSNAYIILDEAQNTTAVQMKMFLTRLGEGSRMVISGDLSQTDLPRTVKSGLRDAIEKISHLEEVGKIRFDDQDVVRHPLTSKIVKAYKEKSKDERWSEEP